MEVKGSIHRLLLPLQEGIVAAGCRHRLTSLCLERASLLALVLANAVLSKCY